MKVGMPCLKLNAGNINAVVREAWLRDDNEQRNCADVDYCPELTMDNAYLFGERRATDLIETTNERKTAYEASSGRKLRKDAVLAIAGIVKPNSLTFSRLSRPEQMRFFEDTLNILQSEDFFDGHLEAFVVQVDEGCPHAHWLATPIAPDGKWSAKKVLNLTFLRKLNDLYPQQMRERGWDVDSLACFDETNYSRMTTEEKAAYVAEKKARKMQHGLSSARYKAEREAEKTLSAAKHIAEKTAEEAAALLKESQDTAEQMIAEAATSVDAARLNADAIENEARVNAALVEYNAKKDARKVLLEATRTAQEAAEQKEAANSLLETLKAELNEFRASVERFMNGKPTPAERFMQSLRFRDGTTAYDRWLDYCQSQVEDIESRAERIQRKAGHKGKSR